MPGIYKLFTAFVALTGNISLVSTGEMNPAFSFVGTGLLWGYYRSLKNLPSLPRWAVGVFSLSTFLIFLLDFYGSGDMLIAVAQMTLIFQTIKSFDIKDSWDPLQVFFMSLLQLLIASELTVAITFGVVFIMFLVFIVISVLLGHFVKEGQITFRPYFAPITFVTVIVIVLTCIFFVSLPRLKSGLWGKSFTRTIKTAGFSDKVDFGSFGAVKLDNKVVMRMVIKPDAPGPHYLRGLTFDYFDGITWYNTVRDKRKIFRTSRDFRLEVPEQIQKYEADIFLEPIDSDVIFTLKMPFMLESPGYFISRDAAGSFYLKQKSSKRFNYRLFSIDSDYADRLYNVAYVQFSDDFGFIERLTREVISGARNDFEKAVTIKNYLTNNYTYSLITEKPPGEMSAIEHFLLHSRRGYCEHFATAMTLMLRSADIPARLVTGFLTSEKNALGGYYLIRQSDAHSWVETYIDDEWLLLDPTPPVIVKKSHGLTHLLDMISLNWNRYVVGFSGYHQARMTSYVWKYGSAFGVDGDVIGRRIFFIAVIIIIFSVVIVLKKRIAFTRARQNRISSEYIRFRKMVSKQGGRIYPSSTSADVLRQAIQTGIPDVEAARQFIDTYEKLRFSGRTEPDIYDDFFEISKKLRK